MKNIVLLGYAGTGKSSFVRKWTRLHFDKRYVATVGVEAFPIGMNITVWDTAGNLSLQGNTAEIIASADVFIIFFSVDSETSYKHAQHLATTLPAGAKAVFVGTKTDIERKVIATETHCFEVSFKTGSGVEKLLTHVKRMV